MTEYVPARNDESVGGATPHRMGIKCAINRRIGDSKSDEVLSNRTESSKPAMKSENYPWKDPGTGFAGNLRR